jgi:FkbM family methyltransferase
LFARHEYACVANEPDVRYIVDCGANIGCSALYLLQRYPRAEIVVVEPDAENMQMCRRNLAPFAGRVTFIQAGVWSASVPMVVERGKYRDGAEWAFQVRPAKPCESPHFVSMTLGDLMAAASFPRIDLLKMDIEAAEQEVFRAGYETWLDRTRTLAVELHDDQCKRAVVRALAGYPFTSLQSGELTVFRKCASPVSTAVPGPASIRAVDTRDLANSSPLAGQW